MGKAEIIYTIKVIVGYSILSGNRFILNRNG